MFIQSRCSDFLKEGNVVSLVLLFNTFSWFLIGQMMIGKISASAGFVEDSPILSLVYYFSIIFSAILGAQFLSKVHNQKQVFYGWLCFGSVISLLPMFAQYGQTLALSFAILMGVSLGIGLPACLTYFTYSLPIEKKGRTAGLILALTFVSTPLIAFLIYELGLVFSSLIFSLWRGWGLLFLIKTSFKSFGRTPRKKEVNFFDVFSNRQLYLYFIAWLMFSFVNGFGGLFLGASAQNFPEELLIKLYRVEPVIAAISAVIAGFVSDWAGRKRVLIFGFVSLGLAYATLGIFTLNLALITIFIVVDGIAIGLLWVIFTLVLWGEVARNGIEKYYAIGEAPFFLTQIISTLVNPFSESTTSVTSIFSLAAFFLFIAVIPLLYARETLPQRKIEERQLKIYTDEALKIKQKVEQKR